MSNPGPPPETQTKNQTVLPKHQSAFKNKAVCCCQTKFEAYIPRINNNGIIVIYINKAEDEHTVRAKNDFKNARRVTIGVAHAATIKHKPNHVLLKQLNNAGYAISKTMCRLVKKIKRNNQQVRFDSK